MSGQLENKKGEKLFILTCVSTNDISPHILINTWKQCIKNLEMATIKEQYVIIRCSSKG